MADAFNNLDAVKHMPTGLIFDTIKSQETRDKFKAVVLGLPYIMSFDSDVEREAAFVKVSVARSPFIDYFIVISQAVSDLSEWSEGVH